MSDTLYRVHDRWRATAHAHISCAQANARTAHNEALAQLATRRGGRGGEERRSVARPPKVKSRGGTGRNTGGESPAAIKRKHKIKGKSGARERRAIARLGGWIRCGHLGSFLGYLYVR